MEHDHFVNMFTEVLNRRESVKQKYATAIQGGFKNTTQKNNYDQITIT